MTYADVIDAMRVYYANNLHSAEALLDGLHTIRAEAEAEVLIEAVEDDVQRKNDDEQGVP
jgi:hypothetical protein